MPLFDEAQLEKRRIEGSPYGFSATRIEDLGATEYTLVGLVADASPSITSFQDEIEACVQEIVRSCRRSPRADNLMLRYTTFAQDVREVHGFRQLAECVPASYAGKLEVGSNTALFDAAHNGIEAVSRYGTDLFESDFDCNAIVFVVTDGLDNASQLTAKDVRAAIERARVEEKLESLTTILVGVNVGAGSALEDVERAAGFDAYVELEKADEATLAGLARFVSKSVSAQSQALGTGASGAITF